MTKRLRGIVSEPGLPGAWKIADSADTWTFEKAESMEYPLTQRLAEYNYAWPALRPGARPEPRLPRVRGGRAG